MGRIHLLAAAIVAAGAQSAFAQDPVKLSPGLYNVLFENDQVRVLEFRARPGDKEPVHFHPSAVVYVQAGGKARIVTGNKTEEVEAPPGTALWMDATTHAFEYLGPGDARILMVEMKGATKASGGGAASESAVSAEIARLTQRFVDAMKAGDVETPVSLWTEDAWAAEPGNPQPMRGREAMRRWFRDTYAAGRITSLAFHPIELKVHGDFAYETGHFVFGLQPATGAAAVNNQGHYFIEWQRGSDGQWRARREVWNNAAPAR